MSDGLRDVIVLDLETARLFGWCQLCGDPKEDHDGADLRCVSPSWPKSWNPSVYIPIGRDDKAHLGLALGGYYSYLHNTYTLFDTQTVAETIQSFLETRPFLVSFNGIDFDFPVMLGALWQHTQNLPFGDPLLSPEAEKRRQGLAEQFRAFYATSYDLLEVIRSLDEANRYTKGLNSLADLCEANHLGTKFGDSMKVPAAWQRREVALVTNHCLADVRLTKRLFDLAGRQSFLERKGGLGLTLPRPEGLPTWWNSEIRRND